MTQTNRFPEPVISGPHSGNRDAPAIVFVHGAMDRAAGFAKVSRRLADDFCVVRYDRRGYAHSLELPGPLTFDQHVLDLAGVLDEVGVRNTTVVGHSFGGNVALAFAERYPARVDAVGVFEAPMPWEPSWPHGSAGERAANAAASAREERDPGAAAEAAADAFMRRFVGDARWERLPRRTKAERLAEGRALVADVDSIRERPPYDYRWVTAPVGVARGELADERQRLGTALLAGRFNVEPMVLDGAGHGAHISHPDAFAAWVRAVVALGHH